MLLGALGTGLPSHHHEDVVRGDPHEQTVSADHHSHGTQLVEQVDRVTSSAPDFVAPTPVAFELIVASTSPRSRTRPEPLRPMERAPPPDAPRAPPRTS